MLSNGPKKIIMKLNYFMARFQQLIFTLFLFLLTYFILKYFGNSLTNYELKNFIYPFP